MMIDKRLIRTVRESKKYIAWNVIYQWISLVANITMMVSIADLLSRLFANTADRENHRFQRVYIARRNLLQ